MKIALGMLLTLVSIPPEFEFTERWEHELPDISRWENTWGEVELCANGKIELLKTIYADKTPFVEAVRIGTEACPDQARLEHVAVVLQYALYVDPAKPLEYSLSQFRFRGFQESYVVWRIDLKRTRTFWFGEAGKNMRERYDWWEYWEGSRNHQAIKDAATWVNALHGQVRHEQERGKLTPVR